jgi:hypothetical protein
MSVNPNSKLLRELCEELDTLPLTEENRRLKMTYQMLADFFDRQSDETCNKSEQPNSDF